jgi:serine/threonine-protein kinase
MQEYHVKCGCGTQLTIFAEAACNCEIRCDQCQQTIFPVMDPTIDLSENDLSEKSSEPNLATLETKVATLTDAPTSVVENSPGEKTPSANPVVSPHSATKSLRVPPPSAVSQKQKEKSDKPEQKIDKYTILKKIGEGGMGVVYLAQDSQTQEQVVVKLVKMEAVPKADQKRMLEMFIREAQVLREMSHPYIVQFKGCGNYQSSPYLAMEFVDGDNLEKEIKQGGTIKLKESLAIIYNLASALEFANSKNFIHRDIKPSNILILRTNRAIPKLIDFGLAKSREAYHSLTLSGAIMGSIYYMPPEQIGDAKNADHRSDLYALGATFYHMLAGQAPFRALGTSTAVMRDKKLGIPPTPLSQLRPDLPKDVCKIVETAMESAPAKRYPTATDFKKAIKNFLQSLSA